MSPATATQVRRRAGVRRDALARQRKLNEERRRQDEQEVDLAVSFALSGEEADAAREALRAAELAMGQVVDRLVGELRIRYPRAADLLEVPEDELRRLRQLAVDHRQNAGAPALRASSASRSKRGRATRAARAPAEPTITPPATPDTGRGNDSEVGVPADLGAAG